MKRLTQSDRDRLRKQLLDALLPDRQAELAQLEQAAFMAVVRNRFSPADLRRIAKLPQDWLVKVDHVYAKPTICDGFRVIYAQAGAMLLPRQPDSSKLALNDAAQAAVDAWWQARSASEEERRGMVYRLDRLLEASSTLESLLTKLPEARAILKLPAAEAVEAIAEDVRSRLAARAGAAP